MEDNNQPDDIPVVDVEAEVPVEEDFVPCIQDGTAYQGAFVNFMMWLHGTTYHKSHRFSQQQLLEVKPLDIFRYFCIRAFGVEVLEKDSRPTLLRGSTLEFYKKSISHFMPNKQPGWDVRTHSGNPTKSALVNNLLARVARHELALQGAISKVKRSLTLDEFKMLITIFETSLSFQVQHRFATMAKYQFHLIGRSDDVAQFKLRDLVGHSNPSFQTFALMCKVRVSKTATNEKNSMDQIFLGSMDYQTCLLLSLAVYLESWMSLHNGQQCFYLFSGESNINETTIENLKTTYLRKLKELTFASPVFRTLSATGDFEDLGSHSLRKFAATFARENDCSPEDIELRGRWKVNLSRVVHRYISPKQPYIDAKVQAAICIGGPIKYCLRENSGITTAWLLQHVVPGIRRKYNNDKNTISEVLALPLLWVVVEATLDVPVPPKLRKKILDAYNTLREMGICPLDDKTNPVERLNICVYRSGTVLHIDQTAGVRNHGGGVHRSEDMSNNSAQINGVMLQVQQTRRQLEGAIAQINGNMNSLSSQIEDRFAVLNRSIHRVAIRPDRMASPEQRQQNFLQQEVVETVVQLKPAILVKNPKSVHELWTEYQFGVAGSKAAKDFTPAERGKAKSTYCRRKRVWDVVAALVRAGHTAPMAIDLIYSTYGRALTVNQIIDKIVKETKNGAQIHMNLRV